MKENRYERIQGLLKQNGFRSVAELERKCGFKNRALVEWAEHRPSADKVLLVAEQLKVSPEYIMNGEDDSLPVFTPQALQFARWSGENQVTPEQMDEILKFGKYVIERDKNDNK